MFTAQTLGLNSDNKHAMRSCVTETDKGVLPLQVWPKYLDICFFITYGVTLILSYTIPAAFVQRWLQVITQGGVFLLITVTVPLCKCVQPETSDTLLPVLRCF